MKILITIISLSVLLSCNSKPEPVKVEVSDTTHVEPQMLMKAFADAGQEPIITEGKDTIYIYTKDTTVTKTQTVTVSTTYPVTRMETREFGGTPPVDTTPIPPTAGTYYVAPNGNDNNNGSINSPFASLNKVWLVVKPGDLIYMRGGRYEFKEQQYLKGKNGTAAQMIKVFAYPGETPILTRNATTYTTKYYRSGVYFSGNYVHFKGLEITGYIQFDAMVHTGLLAQNVNYCIFEQLNSHHNGHGFSLERTSSGGSTGNLLLNCDSHHNYDPITAGDNADGFTIGWLAAGSTTTVRGCRSWWNTDDGYDTWENEGTVIFENNWSFYNGYLPETFTTTQSGDGIGYKLGRTKIATTAFVRVLKNNLAFSNAATAFDKNGCLGGMLFYNNVAYNNAGHGFRPHDTNPVSPATLKNNISYKNKGFAIYADVSHISDHNSAGGTAGTLHNWTANVSDADFVSLSLNGVESARKPDGSMPDLNFLKLAQTSDLINAGVDVGIPFKGSAPDLGAFEF